MFTRLVTGLLFIVMAPALFSQPPDPDLAFVGSVRVTYRDLDLRKDEDARVLLGRLESAAVKACGGNPRLHRSYEIMPSYTKQVFRQCRQESVSRAVDSINATALSRVAASSVP